MHPAILDRHTLAPKSRSLADNTILPPLALPALWPPRRPFALRRRRRSLAALPLLRLRAAAGSAQTAAAAGCLGALGFPARRRGPAGRFRRERIGIAAHLGVERRQRRGFLEVAAGGGREVHGPLAAGRGQEELARLARDRVFVHVLRAEVLVDLERFFDEPLAGQVRCGGLIGRGSCFARLGGAVVSAGGGAGGWDFVGAPEGGRPGLYVRGDGESFGC